MENSNDKDLFKYLKKEQEEYNIVKNDKYYQVKISLPNRPVSNEYIIKLNDYSEKETLDYINDIIVSKHEDCVDTAEWEEETGVEYEYNGSFTKISKITFDVKVEEGIEEITI